MTISFSSSKPKTAVFFNQLLISRNNTNFWELWETKYSCRRNAYIALEEWNMGVIRPNDKRIKLQNIYDKHKLEN